MVHINGSCSLRRGSRRRGRKKNLRSEKKFGERDSASEASGTQGSSPAHSLLTRLLSACPARTRLHSAILPSTQPGSITGPGYLALNPAGSLFAGYGSCSHQHETESCGEFILFGLVYWPVIQNIK